MGVPPRGVATFVKHDVTQEEDVSDFQDRRYSLLVQTLQN